MSGMKPLQPPVLKRLSPAQWVAADCGAALLVVLTSTPMSRTLGELRGPNGIDGAIALLCLLAVAFRRRLDRSALAVVAMVTALAMSFSGTLAPLVAVGFLMYMVPFRFGQRSSALWLLGGTLAAGVVGASSLIRLPYGPPAVHGPVLQPVSALLITLAWTIGFGVQRQRMYTAGLQEQAALEAQEKLAEARRAISEERVRIARELHDVVAHTMSVIAVQAGVANHVAREQPGEVHRALSSIEEASRGALREMRALLGVLRTDGEAVDQKEQQAETAPVPGLADLHSLVESAAQAGLRVDLEISGERPKVSAGLELAAYRIIQEATTNVIKHAGTDRSRVSLSYQPDSLTVEVTDTGNGDLGGSVLEGAGHGIVGMRERVAMYGGDFHAGPLPHGGFRVRATFCLQTEVLA